MQTRLALRQLITFSVFIFASLTAHGQEERVVTKADMPRLPHVEPADAIKSFELAAGFSIELVAAEPFVSDPVDACFDEYGRMYVAEMHGYPFSEEPTKLNPSGGGKPSAGIIRRLEDSNGDGRMDKSIVFADKLSWPTSVCCYNGGIFVLAPQHLYYLKDTTGDGKADVRETVLVGFGRGNVQAVTNGLQWGLDNRIYFAAGRNSADLQHRGKPLFKIKSSDIRFDPKTESFEAVSGGLQFGHTRDNWGTRFVCSNSNHMMQVVYPEGYLSRNPFFVASAPVKSIATDGASARVFRRSPPEPWRIVRQKWRALDKGYRLDVEADGGWKFTPLDPIKTKQGIPTEYPVGFFTSATGITIYRGDAYPPKFRGNAFVGDVGGNLIHRKTVDSSGVIYKASRADIGEEIAASTDTWFRPVNFVNAPDGSLYVLDMYRETIEHPYSIPEEIKAFLNLSSGDDRGRIYRLVSSDMQRRKVIQIGNLNDSELVQQLASGNGWNRDTAQRLIWERQSKTLAPLIARLFTTTESSVGRMHCLNALNGLGALDIDLLMTGLTDSHDRVRQHAIRLAESRAEDSGELRTQLVKMVSDKSEHVRFQLAFTLGNINHEDATAALTQMCLASNSDPVTTAVMSSVKDSAGMIALKLLRQNAKSAISNQTFKTLRQLAIITGANPDSSQAVALLTELFSRKLGQKTTNTIKAVGAGLDRRGVSLNSIIQTEQAAAELKKQSIKMFDHAAETAVNTGSTIEARIAAIEILALDTKQKSSIALSSLLSAATAPPLQLATARTLGQQSTQQFVKQMAMNWRGLSPGIRSEAISIFLTTDAGTRLLLEQLEGKGIATTDLTRSQKQALLNHRNTQLRTQASKAMETESASNRSNVVANHQAVLTLNGNTDRGQEVFKKHCSTCHRVGKMGANVAPDLASVKNKSAGDLLIAILDPNRESLPNYNSYTVVTLQGKSFSGIVAAETATSLTLRQPEGKQQIVLRSNIDELVSTGLSLMPEGLEKDLSQQQLADVISFVKSIESNNASSK